MRAAFFLILLLCQVACVSRHQVLYDYSYSLRSTDNKLQTPQTLVFFLVDGFPVGLMRELLSHGSLPNMRRYFLRDSNEFRLGRSVFPSLTHSNISSILTSRNVDRHPILANKIYWQGELVNFENPLRVELLSELIRPYSVFSSLSRQNRRSVSVAAYYGDQATSRYALDAELGLAYGSQRFAKIDHKLLDSLELMLKKTSFEQWPEFIFVHLVGIDGYLHHYGMDSVEARQHASRIDQQLGRVFAQLEKASLSGRRIAAILTSDHGMVAVPHRSDAESALLALAPQAKLINHGRFLSLNFSPLQKDTLVRREVARKSVHLRGAAIAAVNEGPVIRIYTKEKTIPLYVRESRCAGNDPFALSFDGKAFYCPKEFNKISQNFFYPYFATNLATFFRAPSKPDFLLLAAEGFAFSTDLRAHHGGMTPEEVFVPVLSWQYRLDDSEPVLPTFKLLAPLFGGN